MGENEEEKNIQAGQLFENFVQASTCKGTLQSFNILCRHLELDTQDYRNFYTNLKSKVCTWKAKGLWSKLDKRASHKEYKRGKACLQTKCLIIGGGPCGLRTAIELSLLGAKVVVIEKRDSFSRNNVLHLWPYTIHDLRALGAKKFYGKFCAGSIDHISIRQLQLMLLKVALILGVEIHVNVEFVKLLEPPEDQENERISWRAEVNPVDHYVSKFDFDIIIGADGRRSTLDGFRRKEFRGKLAIAITANFINRNTTAEAKVEEISGVAFIFNQKFFQDLKEETGIDLENIVYYKDNTHYFVMTAKKQSLLDKGVILNDYIDTEVLLSSDNVDQEALQSYAREAADFATNYQLPTLDFAINHYGQPDVDMFDFTCMYASENAALVRERQGHKLIVALVGDSLLEPFWPMGTGCARGFLAAFDTAWMVRNWSQGVSPLELLAERESIYRLLPQTTPENISKNFDQYTLDPGTRYPNLNSNCVRPHQVRHLYVTDELQNCTIERSSSLKRSVRVKRHESDIRPNKLLTWCQQQTEGYKNVSVTNLTTSWKSGLALCALIHHFKPELIDFDSLNEEAVAKNNQLAFDIAEQELGIPPITTGKEMASVEEPDKLSMVMYLSKFYMLFRAMPLTSADIYIRENGDRNEPKRSHSLPSNYQNLTLPRKRIPKENKTTEDDALSKRRRKGFATADEPTSFSNQSASSGSECGETKEVINQNKVKSMATQLLAKFEENAPISSVRRQLAESSNSMELQLTNSDTTLHPRFARPKEVIPSPNPPKRQAVVSTDYLVRQPKHLMNSTDYRSRQSKSREKDQNHPQSESADHFTSARSSVIAATGILQRLQRLEDKLEQKRAQILEARTFQKKSIKDRAAILASKFADTTSSKQQNSVPAVCLSHVHSAVVSSCSSNNLATTSLPLCISSASEPLRQTNGIKNLAKNLEKLFSKVDTPEVSVKNEKRTGFINHYTGEKATSKQKVNPTCQGQMTVGKVSATIGARAEVLVSLYENDHRPRPCTKSSVQQKSAGAALSLPSCSDSSSVDVSSCAFPVEDFKSATRKVSSEIGYRTQVLLDLYEHDHKPQKCNKYQSQCFSVDRTDSLSSCPDSVGFSSVAALPDEDFQASLRKEFPQNFGGSDICYFCKKRVYVMERLSAEGQFFHRECFRCEFCGTTLRLGIYAFDADEGKFYCKPHFAYCKTSNKQRKRRQELEMETKADGSMQEEEPKHSKMNTEDISEAANSMTERHPDSPLQKCDEPTQPKKSKNDLYSSSCEGQSSVISEWTTVRVIPEEEMAEHNLLAVRVMINSDETSSESESEPQGKLLSSQKFAPVTASPFNPAKNSDYLRRHASLNNSSVNREESSIRSKAADALQRAHSFHSTTYERYQSWRSKFKMTLPVFARKGPELSSTEKPSSSHAFQECSSEPQESLTVYQREQSKFHIPKFIKQNVKLQESSVPAYIPHGKDITTVQNINHKDNVQTNLLESSVEYRGKTASIYGQEGKYLSSADEYTQSSETATQKHTSQDPFIVGKKDYNTIQDEPKNNQGLLSMKKAAYLSFQKPKFHWQHEPLGNGHRNKIHVKKTSSESAIIKGSIDRETEKPSDSSALPMSNRKASPPLSEGQNGLSVPLKDKNSTVGGTDDAPLSPLKLLANAVRRSFTSWSSSSSSPEQSRKANKVSDSSFSRDTENIDLDVEDGTDVSHMGQTRKYSENKDSAANHNSALEKDKDISSIDEITENSFLDSSPPDKASGDTTKYVYGTCQNNKLEDVVQKLLEKISLKDRNPVTNNTDFGSTQFSVSSHSSKDDYISSSDESGRKSATKLKMDRYPRKKKRHTTAKYKEKQEELQRLHRAQTIQRQLQELEEKQQTLEEKGVKLEKMLRGESECSSEDENRTLQEWFKLVVEKNKVDRYVSELLICAQELELEDQQRRLQQEWREKIIIDDSEKTQDELNEEKERLIKILQIVEKRDKLVSVLEQQRLKENQEDRDFKEFVLSTGYQFKNN
ncbi:F-actin-monooxygenase MICAL2-like isoform X4 [Protopterus annectens]|uniref:F-actin-monooxygenase MICAL2-like isoform X4 n=1 Tax=Protopterus annectens TaxID=7888 RepID=UPI001CFB74FF|nr:F-actin-monooxygenase MICAL2-like isoform X4 [Protopterus annectens]